MEQLTRFVSKGKWLPAVHRVREGVCPVCGGKADTYEPEYVGDDTIVPGDCYKGHNWRTVYTVSCITTL